MGDPVRESLSPVMQNAAFDALGINCRYIPKEIRRADLAEAMAEFRADRRILGANVTIPHKESVIPFLDALDASAGRIGAVNTIRREGAQLNGWNTDVEGFRRAAEESGYVIAGKNVAVIGAGGAARAVVAAAYPLAARLVIIARTLDAAERLRRDLDARTAQVAPLDRAKEVIRQAETVVNATPADLPPADWLTNRQQVFDLRSRRSAEGRAMLLHQGAASFELWTGRPAPVAVMRAALDQAAAGVPA
jgi:shikimate dehydrogenase